MADVAHRKLGVALGEGQKLVQGRWGVLRHKLNSADNQQRRQDVVSDMRERGWPNRPAFRI
jgi:hypothetical protein